MLRRNDVVIVMSEDHYERFVRKRLSFKDFLLNAPDMADLDLERDRTPTPNVEP